MRVIRGFTKAIYLAVKDGKLKQPFNAAIAKKACPGWADRTYVNFFGKHSEGRKTLRGSSPLVEVCID